MLTTNMQFNFLKILALINYQDSFHLSHIIFSRNECVRMHVYLFVCLFGFKKEDLAPRYSHTYYTKLPFFEFLVFLLFTGLLEMGEHPG